MLNLKQYTTQEVDDLESDILELYKKLSTASYLKDVQISELAENIFENLHTHQRYQPLLIIDKVLMIMNGLLSLGIKFTTYSAYERRFDQFLSSLGNRVITLLKEHNHTLSIKERKTITEVFIQLYTKYLNTGSLVWSDILAKWLIENEQENWAHSYYQYFKQLHNEYEDHFNLSMTTSLLALICQDGVGSLTYLKSYKQRLTANDLYHHFTLLNSRQEWDTIQRWFDLFSPSWNGHLEKLQPFYNTLVEKNYASFDLTSRLSKWMNRPTFETYKDLSSSLNEKERHLLFDRVSEHLSDQLTYPQIQNLMMQIFLYEKRWDAAIYYFLNNEHHPFQLSNEKQQLLEQLEKHLPDRTIPIYHQFIVRLVEKKMRSHYSEAVMYMRKLKGLYHLSNQPDRFKQFITIFSQTYKTYRALIQEMKTIDE
ncbi:hypothetical protein [Alkalihalobacterium elongatum]|uniref:hypothetical protein n=1 Tax=Alkalihalobacterium elongatum TaxID=2675466 RepID=UPI001C1FE20D|nr:hypothetical protein [Alkalihalobacterium elongatum]